MRGYLNQYCSRDADFRLAHKIILKRLVSKERYEISTAVTLRVPIFWDVTLCSAQFSISRRFEGPGYLDLHRLVEPDRPCSRTVLC